MVAHGGVHAERWLWCAVFMIGISACNTKTTPAPTAEERAWAALGPCPITCERIARCSYGNTGYDLPADAVPLVGEFSSIFTRRPFPRSRGIDAFTAVVTMCIVECQKSKSAGALHACWEAKQCAEIPKKDELDFRDCG